MSLSFWGFVDVKSTGNGRSMCTSVMRLDEGSLRCMNAAVLPKWFRRRISHVEKELCEHCLGDFNPAEVC